MLSIFFFQAEDGIRDYKVTGVQTCALPISHRKRCVRGHGAVDWTFYLCSHRQYLGRAVLSDDRSQHDLHRRELTAQGDPRHRSEEHTSELQSPCNLVCRLLLEKKKF